MATGGIGVPLEDIANILQCSICLEIFKSPRTLPCSHTFCNKCLEIAVPVIQHAGQMGINCPLCRKFHKAGEYINSFLVHQFMELYTKCTDQVTNCYACDKEAKWRCVDCKLNMCATCQHLHSVTPMLKDHKYQPFTAEANFTLDEIFYCERHKGQKLELHCIQCESLICMMCRATSHSNHNCETVDEGNERFTKKVQDILKSLTQDLEECKAQDKFLEYHHELMEKDCKEVKEKYQNEKKRLMAAIEKQEQEALKQIEKSARQNHKRIQAARDQNKAQIQVKQRLLDTSTTTLSSAKGSSLLKILTGDLMQKLIEEGKKPVKNASVDVTMPAFNGNTEFTEDFVFVNPPNIANHTRSFQPGTSGVRSLNVKCGDVMSSVGEQEVEVKVQGGPFNLGCVDSNIWIPSNKVTGYYEVFNICDKTITQKSHDTLKGVFGFCQSSNNDVIAACNNGLYSLNTNGKVQYKITDGYFTDVCTEGESLVAVECNECQIHICTITNNKWTKETEFTVKDPDKRLKLIHVNHNSVYVCYPWTNKIYKYSLQGEYIEEYGTVQGNALGEFYGPYVSGTDCQGSVIVCDKCNYRIQVRSSQGEWQQYKLEGITEVTDVLVVKGRLFVLWGLPDNVKLTVYKINIFK